MAFYSAAALSIKKNQKIKIKTVLGRNYVEEIKV